MKYLTRRLRLFVTLVTALAPHAGPAVAAATVDATQVARGRYLAIAGDCGACHTVTGGEAFAGGLPVVTPIGTIMSTNITPSGSHGIGKYSLQQFGDAVRRGLRADGRRLYPAMPYTAYARVGDQDVAALYAYFMHGVRSVNSSPAPTRLPFPFNIRLSMAAWNLLFLDSKPFRPDLSKSAAWNRGAYLARGLAHCGTCHTPRNVLMAEEPSRDLGGADVGAWKAPNITSDPNSGIGAWTATDIVNYLKLGHALGRAQAAGPMAEAVDDSLQFLTAEDLEAIAIYLRTVPPQHDPADTRAVDSWGTASNELVVLRGAAWPTDPDQMTGAQLYDGYCASCHQASGQGSFDGGLPSLFHNTSTGRANTDNLVMVILEGIRWRAGDSGVHMPAFAASLSDRQIASLGQYLIAHFGNPAATVSVGQVQSLRKGGAASHLVLVARVGLTIVVLVLTVLLYLLIRRRWPATDPNGR